MRIDDSPEVAAGVTIFLVLATALVLSLIGTPLARDLARRAGVLDRPSGRKLHTEIMPMLGGLSIFAATLLPTVLAWTLIGEHLRPGDAWIACGAGAVSVLLIGVRDDITDLRPRRKLALQFIVACAVVAGGLRVPALTLPGVSVSLGWASAPVTVLWILTVMNAWNLLDGMDGLAAGVAAIAAALLGFWMLEADRWANACLFFALAGACLGFLRYNFHPASIFMGDCGSLFVGYALAVGSVLGTDPAAGGRPLDLRIPFLVFLVPLGDTAAAIVRRGLLFGRVRRAWGVAPWDLLRRIGAADKRHIHHHLLQRGMGQKAAAAIVYMISLLSGAAALLSTSGIVAICLVTGAALGMGVLLLRLGCFLPAPAGSLGTPGRVDHNLAAIRLEARPALSESTRRAA